MDYAFIAVVSLLEDATAPQSSLEGASLCRLRAFHSRTRIDGLWVLRKFSAVRIDYKAHAVELQQ